MAITRSQSSKRRRTHLRGQNIDGLPDSVLTIVAEFLPKTSVALFAAAFSKSGASATSKTIISSYKKSSSVEPWGVFDFLDIDKSLRVKLSDEDLKGILTCIDAANKLRRLKLTHCFDVTGRGLEPLRGSVVLEQLDLSLVDLHEHTGDISWVGVPRVSEKDVLPILDSIIDKEFSVLRQLQFPKKWRDEKKQSFRRFVGNYNQYLLEKEIATCSFCDDICRNTMVCEYEDQSDYGVQTTTCYKCMKHFCAYCDDVGYCYPCHKAFCDDCVPVQCCEAWSTEVGSNDVPASEA